MFSKKVPNGGIRGGRVRSGAVAKLRHWVFMAALILAATACGEFLTVADTDEVLSAGGSAEDTNGETTSLAGAVADAQAAFDLALRSAPLVDEVEVGFLGQVPVHLASSFEAASQTLVLDVRFDVPGAGQQLIPEIEFSFWQNLARGGGIEAYNSILLDSLVRAGVPRSEASDWAVTAVRLTSGSTEIACPDMLNIVSCVDDARPAPPSPTGGPTDAMAATAVPPTAVPSATAVQAPTATAVPPTPVPPTPVPPPPTPVPPTPVPPTPVPPTPVPPTPVPPTPVPPTPIPTAIPQPVAPAPQACTPGYSPCIPLGPDVDCAGGSGNGPRYTGQVVVTGPDPYDLDRDNDGIGCE